MVRKLTTTSSLFLLMIVGLSGTLRAQEPDQEQTAHTTNITNFNNVGLAQSCVQSQDNIAGAGLLVRPTFYGGPSAVSADITISVYEYMNVAGPGTGPTSFIASGTVHLGSITGDVWADVFFGGPVPLTAGQTIYLVFSADNIVFENGEGDPYYPDNPVPQYNYINLRGDTSNPYPYGITYAQWYDPSQWKYIPWTPYTSFDYAFRTYYLDVLYVDIDIKPGNENNSVNLGSNGVIPVAILSTETFNAATVDPSSVLLAGSGVAVRGKGKTLAHIQDVNGDGLMDLLVHVETENLDPGQLQDGMATLTGSTVGGQAIEGSDYIRIVPIE